MKKSKKKIKDKVRKTRKNMKKKSTSSITGGTNSFNEIDLKYDTPAQIINASKELIDAFRKGQLKEGRLKAIAYVLSTVTIPAHKLNIEKQTLDREERIAVALERRNELLEEQLKS